MLKKILILGAFVLAFATNYFIKSDVTATNPQLSVKERTQIYENKAQQAQNKVQQLTPPQSQAPTIPMQPTYGPKSITVTAQAPAKKVDAEIESMQLPTPPEPPKPKTVDQAVKIPDEQLKKMLSQTEKDAFLLQAATQGNNNAVQKFIGIGANIKTQDKNGNTPLLLATAPDVVNKLIFLGAPINVRNNQLQSPLVKIIIDKNISPSSADKIVGIFLGQPTTDIELKDNSGKTALMHAALLRKANMVEELLRFYKNPAKKIAYVQKKDADGRTALQHVVNGLNTLMLSKPQDAKKKLADLKKDPVYKDFITIIQLLLDKGANPEELVQPATGQRGEQVESSKTPAVLTELYQAAQPKKKK